MATIREYFDTDIKCMCLQTEWQLHNGMGENIESVFVKIALEYDANAKYLALYISEGSNILEKARAIFRSQEAAQCVLTSSGDGIEIMTGFADYPEKASSTTLVFTKRIFLYINESLSPEERGRIADEGGLHGFHVLVRDRCYAEIRSGFEKPLAFISHDSRDKDALVRDLVVDLSKNMCPVWYDEYSLAVGDDLRESIEKGLREAKKCILVLSPNFLSNEGWTKAEYDSIFTREIMEKNDVILPVWHNVTAKDIYEYSPRLANKVGIPSSVGIPEISKRLARKLK